MSGYSVRRRPEPNALFAIRGATRELGEHPQQRPFTAEKSTQEKKIKTRMGNQSTDE